MLSMHISISKQVPEGSQKTCVTFSRSPGYSAYTLLIPKLTTLDAHHDAFLKYPRGNTDSYLNTGQHICTGM